MICVIACLKEHASYFTEMSCTDIKTYKYHAVITLASPFGFTLLSFMCLGIPIQVKYSETSGTTLRIYTKDNALSTPKTTTTPKPINWKVQHQRYKVHQLLKMTG